jgi:hypothetical protein
VISEREQLNAKLFVKAGKDFRRDFFRGAGDEIERGKIRLRAGLPHMLENIFQHRRYGDELGHLGARHRAQHRLGKRRTSHQNGVAPQ